MTPVRATVVTVTPLTVRLDSGDAVLPASHLTYAAAPIIGERVAVVPFDGGLLVLGKVYP